MVGVPHVVGCVVLGHQFDRAGLHAQVDVLADQDNAVVLQLFRQVVGDVEDAVILFFNIGEYFLQLGMHALFQPNGDFAFALTDPHAAVEELVAAQLVQFP